MAETDCEACASVKWEVALILRLYSTFDREKSVLANTARHYNF